MLAVFCRVRPILFVSVGIGIDRHSIFISPPIPVVMFFFGSSVAVVHPALVRPTQGYCSCYGLSFSGGQCDLFARAQSQQPDGRCDHSLGMTGVS